MCIHEMSRRRTRPAATAGAVAVAVLVALALLAGCDRRQAEYAGVSNTVAPQGQDQARRAEGARAAEDFRSTRGYRPTPAPVHLEIPAIGVDTRLQRLGRAGDGTVDVPSGPGKWEEAGWYEEGTRPGDPGSAVILGHVDSKAGPAVFYRLRQLRRGDRVEVVRAGGSRVTFVVDRVEQYDKRRFPTADVYYPTGRPRLRLVTCGGPFDDTTGHYTHNVIVFASQRG
jgi:sortase (surface protein transpeptidase)